MARRIEYPNPDIKCAWCGRDIGSDSRFYFKYKGKAFCSRYNKNSDLENICLKNYLVEEMGAEITEEEVDREPEYIMDEEVLYGLGA
ncbi:hypothetical protein bpr_II408 (plasmid) [Butyrivibrio proteoclasticus B316]|uniref:Uncharacterized protein n=1 Tax=Butyrivibrio proteoclasticus (strain ATCC 51982 / DSM 14932 / B316) TaxID=515622 RepID=E0S4L3_BUTPB|nr:hypothetical protein [Butyrivibrio proteoclasticus]ADL36345.1 hypothetical protein bpr_II408 [Butyrivibrio proteoclasticus B316]